MLDEANIEEARRLARNGATRGNVSEVAVIAAMFGLIFAGRGIVSMVSGTAAWLRDR